MKCVYCQVKHCQTCTLSPFFGLPLGDAPFSELTIERTPPEQRVLLTKDFSISGVQQKYSLVLEEDSGKLVMRNQGGQFIMKPEINNFHFVHGNFSVENEHITMRLAARMGLTTALNCIIPLGGTSLGYVTKRFDYIKDDDNLLMEDFGQMMGVDATGDGKYDYTVEEMGQAIDNRLAGNLVLKAELFRRVVANFILCNGDAHLKNYSLIQASINSETRVFSPIYDVMNTIIHIPEGKEVALALTKDGRRQVRDLRKEGFDTLATRLGIRLRARDNIYKTLLRNMEGFMETLFAEAPGMNHEIRNQYIETIQERIDRLRS